MHLYFIFVIATVLQPKVSPFINSNLNTEHLKKKKQQQLINTLGPLLGTLSTKTPLSQAYVGRRLSARFDASQV